MFSLRCSLVLKISIFNLRDLFSVPNFSSIQLRVGHHSRIVFSLLINFWLGSTKIQHQPIFFLLWIYCKVDILYWFSKIVSLWSLLYWWNKEKLFFSGITNFSVNVGRIHLPDVVSYDRKTFEIFQEFLYHKLSFLICCC